MSETHKDPARRRRSRGGVRTALGLIVDGSVYALLFALLLAPIAWWWKPAVVIACAAAIGRLALIGHEACHGSLFPSSWRCNAVMGRLVFLPSLTPFRSWELCHNTLHHGFTNLRGKDVMFPPLSPDEFRRLPWWRRMLERIYRHPLGPGLYYLVEVWWKHLWFPRGGPILDSLFTLSYGVAQALLIALVARKTGQNAAMLAGAAVVAPFVLWNFAAGFVTYQQHTHPDVIWYADRRDWDPVTAQLQGSIHIEVPKWMSMLLGNIFCHTAHHRDVSLSRADLPEAQRRIETEFPGEVKVVRWTFGYYLDCCRRCKLFDYEARRWTGFD